VGPAGLRVQAGRATAINPFEAYKNVIAGSFTCHCERSEAICPLVTLCQQIASSLRSSQRQNLSGSSQRQNLSGSTQ
jgi:hypothetical protein